MKQILVALFFLIAINAKAQKQYNVGFETVFVPGQIVSTLKLVDYANKQIGSRITHTAFDAKKAVFTTVTTENDAAYLIILQVITKDALKGLVQDIEVKKAWINPEEKTIPKNYWEVSVGFRKANGDVAEVGATTHYKNEDGTAIINKYLGTSYTVPFATKAAADAFVTSLKNFIK